MKTTCQHYYTQAGNSLGKFFKRMKSTKEANHCCDIKKLLFYFAPKIITCISVFLSGRVFILFLTMEELAQK